MTQGEHSISRRLDSSPAPRGGPAPAQLADVLERVLDKGIVVAGDIQINLLDKAKEMGIDWWEGDPFLKRGDQNGALEERLRRLEAAAGLEPADRSERSAE